jgi:SAM-dependent methyltransferase
MPEPTTHALAQPAPELLTGVHAAADRLAAALRAPAARTETLERALAALSDELAIVDRALELDPEGRRSVQEAAHPRLGRILSASRLLERAITKPRGYAGDHAMIDMLYRGERAPGGAARALDEAVLKIATVVAVVRRKEYAVRWVAERLRAPGAHVVDLACGPCRVERELLERGVAARLVGIDSDPEALAYARGVLGPHAASVELVNDNAIRIARSATPTPVLQGARLVLSLGLFDYLPAVIAIRVLRALRRDMHPEGEVLIGNFAAGSPDRPFMDWALGWPLIYRTEREVRELLTAAGFPAGGISLERETPTGLVLMATARCS